MSRQATGKLPGDSGSAAHSGVLASQGGNAPQPEVPSHNRWLSAAVCVLLSAAVWAAFGQTVRHGFLNFDDNVYVYENPLVQKGLTIRNIGWVFTHAECHFYHPLTMLSLMLDYQLYGLHPGGYHLANVLLHAASAVLLFLVLRQTTGALWRSAFVAAVFAIHPLRAESVAWVAERKDVLCGLFFMVTLGAYVRYVRRPFSMGNYLLVLACFTAGLLAKPAIVTVPFLLILLDYWPLGRFANASARSLILEKIPLLLLSIAASVVAVFAQGAGVTSTAHYSIPVRLGNVTVSYVIYLVQMIFPVGLAPYYQHLGGSLPLWQILLSLVALATISTLALLGWRRRPYVTVGWLWYLGMLVPMIGLVQIGTFAHADRFTYLPQIGVYAALTWLVADWAGEWRYRRAMLGSVAVVILCLLVVAAYRQTSYWCDGVTLWTHALRSTRDNSTVHYHLGNAMVQQGRTEEAMTQFFKTVQIDPTNAEAHNNLGTTLLDQGRRDEAAAEYLAAVQINPAYAEARRNLGNVLLQQGRTEEAIAQFREALQINPAYAAARSNLGNALLDLGRTGEAILEYQQALQLNPSDALTHNNLGKALLQQGNAAEAINQMQRALELQPTNAAIQNNLAWILATAPQAALRNGAMAVQLATQASQSSGGNNPLILYTLAAAYAEAGDFFNAVQTAQHALQLAEAQSNTDLANTLRRDIKLYEAGKALPEGQ